MRTTKMYDILLSCPNDVPATVFRSVKTAINECNLYLGKDNIFVNLMHWSTDGYPQSGGQPQQLLNTQIVDVADAAIAIFWTRFGTPTEKFGGGTEEEIERMLQSGKQVFLYFLDKPILPMMLSDSKAIADYNKIQIFKNKYKDKGIYWNIKNENCLLRELKRHLPHYLNDNVIKQNKQNENSKESDIEKIQPEEERDLVIQKSVFLDYEWKNIIDKYAHIKNLYIECEETDPELKTTLFPLVELRSVLDHVFRLIFVKFSNSITIEEGSELNHINNHLDRAFFHLYELLFVNYRNAIITNLEPFSSYEIREGIPKYFTEYRPAIMDLTQKIINFRKNIECAKLNDMAMTGYMNDIIRMRDIFLEIRRFIPNIKGRKKRIKQR